MTTLLHDLRFALRMLFKHHGFSVAAVLALALGIGGNTAIFSVINSVLLRPLPYANPDEIVALEGVNRAQGINSSNISMPDFVSWSEGSQAFREIALFVTGSASFSRDGSEPERLPRAIVTDGFFKVMGLQPVLGRTFSAQDAQPGSEPVAVLSDALWKRNFGGDPNVVGRKVMLSARPTTIIGVMPPKFDFPERAQIWGPLPMDLNGENRDNRSCAAIARLKRDSSVEQAQAQLTAINARLAAQFRETNAGRDTHVLRLRDALVRDVRLPLIVLAGAVAFVLLIACANVANLLLARTAARKREMAIRAALGASRARVLRQLLTESVVLAVIGGAIGVMLGLWFTELLVWLSPPDTPRFDQITLDLRVLIFALLISTLTGLAFGLIPAWHATRENVSEALNARSATESIRSRARSLLLIGEVGFSLVLLVGAGLLIQSFIHLREVNPGFNPNHVLTASISLPRARYKDDQSRLEFFHQLREHLSRVPGVSSVATVLTLPLGGSDYDIGRAFVPEGKALAPENSANASYSLASPEYFATMQIPLIAGRVFNERDDAQSPKVVIVNQKLAKQCFGSPENAIGKRLTVWRDEKFAREIIGVVGNTKPARLDRRDEPQIYVPHSQDGGWGFLSVILRTKGQAHEFVSRLRGEVLALDKDQPIYNVQTLKEVVAKSSATSRVSTMLFSAFAGIALLLSALGIYSVIAYTVTLRTHEIGVRIALGAQPKDVLQLVIGQGVALALIGVLAGLAGAFALTRLMGNLLFGVRANDPLTFVGISLLLLFVSILACYFPARRAAAVNPMIALMGN